MDQVLSHSNTLLPLLTEIANIVEIGLPHTPEGGTISHGSSVIKSARVGSQLGKNPQFSVPTICMSRETSRRFKKADSNNHKTTKVSKRHNRPTYQQHMEACLPELLLAAEDVNAYERRLLRSLAEIAM